MEQAGSGAGSGADQGAGRSEQTYPVETIAKLLMLTPRRVQYLVKEGVIPKDERGRYPLVGSIQGYIHYLQSKEKQGAKRLDEDARLRAAQADLRMLELDKARGKLVAMDTIDGAMIDVIRVLCGGLDALPARVAHDLDGPQRRRVNDECQNIKDAVAAGLGALSKKYAALARRSAEAAKANRRRVGRRKPRAAKGAGRAGPVPKQPDPVPTAAR